jgi:hypothetical protein
METTKNLINNYLTGKNIKIKSNEKTVDGLVLGFDWVSVPHGESVVEVMILTKDNKQEWVELHPDTLIELK